MDLLDSLFGRFLLWPFYITGEVLRLPFGSGQRHVRWWEMGDWNTCWVSTLVGVCVWAGLFGALGWILS